MGSNHPVMFPLASNRKLSGFAVSTRSLRFVTFRICCRAFSAAAPVRLSNVFPSTKLAGDRGATSWRSTDPPLEVPWGVLRAKKPDGAVSEGAAPLGATRKNRDQGL